jgi:hypothetical protein
MLELCLSRWQSPHTLQTVNQWCMGAPWSQCTRSNITNPPTRSGICTFVVEHQRSLANCNTLMTRDGQTQITTNGLVFMGHSNQATKYHHIQNVCTSLMHLRVLMPWNKNFLTLKKVYWSLLLQLTSLCQIWHIGTDLKHSKLFLK